MEEIEYINKTLNRIESGLSLAIQAGVGCVLSNAECEVLFFSLREMREKLSEEESER